MLAKKPLKLKKNSFCQLTILLLLFCFFNAQSFAKDQSKIIIDEIKFSAENNLIIQVSSKTNFKVFTLEKPDRLVIDIENASLKKADQNVTLPAFANKFRTGIWQNNLRIVFDLNAKILINKTSFQKTNDSNFSKIIISLDDGINKSPKYTLTNDLNLKNQIITKKFPVIVIDAGHGGKDPGTIGDYARTKEKNITLSYAKELKKSLENTKHYKIYLTRETDIFIPLRQRVNIARNRKADLFISLHANSILEPRTSGFSIYTLSEKSSDRQAELLAQKENRADIISGINFSGASPDIMKTLIDLSQRDSMNNSSSFANTVIKSIKKSRVKILQNSHRYAGFAVLTAPDMSSVLIELGYLSNAEEEKQLNNLIYKRKLVTSITEAIEEYFYK